ncbi:MAG: hypothetical protein C0506_04315 [Anaerolinea sp.]|nr:hypothetical protein [Anaerolinea sp.]
MLLRGLAGVLGIWAIGAVTLRAVLVPAQFCPPVTPEGALSSAREAAAWIERAQKPDGSYLYEYNRDTGTESPDYNVVRHAGVTMSLYQLASVDESVLPAADRGLAWMRDNLARYDGWAALQDPRSGGIELGGSALMLAALAQRRLATDDPQYDGLMREVARFILVMQQDDGSFLLRWLPATRAPQPDQRSKYATGEAFWALAMMHRIFPDEGWDVPVRKVADYLSCCRDSVEEQKFPPWADQWAAYGLAEMAAWPGEGPHLNEANVAYTRSLADRFGFLVRVESQRRQDWFSDAIHGRQARAAGMGTWGEALDSLWRLAGDDPRLADIRDKVGERAVCTAGMLADRQVKTASTTEPLLGGWFTEGITRMDDQQHALSALLRSTEIIASRTKEPK